MALIVGGMIVVTLDVSRASLLSTAQASLLTSTDVLEGPSRTTVVDPKFETNAGIIVRLSSSPIPAATVRPTARAVVPLSAAPAPRPTPTAARSASHLPVVPPAPSLAPTASPTPAATPAPVPLLIVTPTSGSAPLLVSADASRWIDPNGSSIVSYHFDFLDGTVADAPNGLATHTYRQAGTYQLTVIITDAAGIRWTAMATVKVS